MRGVNAQKDADDEQSPEGRGDGNDADINKEPDTLHEEIQEEFHFSSSFFAGGS